MIGVISLAGIIVRNAILPVNFVRHTDRAGRSMHAGAQEVDDVRLKRMLPAAMIGAALIPSDPIIQALAVSLPFELASSTATVLIIPLICRAPCDPS